MQEKQYLDMLIESSHIVSNLQPDINFLNESEVDEWLWVFEESEDIMNMLENTKSIEKTNIAIKGYKKGAVQGGLVGAGMVGGVFALYKGLQALYRKMLAAKKTRDPKKIAKLDKKIAAQKAKIAAQKAKQENIQQESIGKEIRSTVQQSFDTPEGRKISKQGAKNIGTAAGRGHGFVGGATLGVAGIVLYKTIKSLYKLFKKEGDPVKRKELKTKIKDKKAELKELKKKKG